jgi:hypothetical protein
MTRSRVDEDDRRKQYACMSHGFIPQRDLGNQPFSSNCRSFWKAALIARSLRPNPQYMFGASHRIPPGESTPLVEAHRSDTQSKLTQNTVNDTCEEIILKILATIKVRSLDYWGHIHVRPFYCLRWFWETKPFVQP